MAFTSFTNGLLITQERAERIVACGLGTLVFSIDGSTAAMHDAVRGVPGSFEKATAAVEMISLQKEMTGSDFFRVSRYPRPFPLGQMSDIMNMPGLAARLARPPWIFICIPPSTPRSWMRQTGNSGKRRYPPFVLSSSEMHLMLLGKQLDEARISAMFGPMFAADTSGFAVSFDPLIMKTKREMLLRGDFAFEGRTISGTTPSFPPSATCSPVRCSRNISWEIF